MSKLCRRAYDIEEERPKNNRKSQTRNTPKDRRTDGGARPERMKTGARFQEDLQDARWCKPTTLTREMYITHWKVLRLRREFNYLFFRGSAKQKSAVVLDLDSKFARNIMG